MTGDEALSSAEPSGEDVPLAGAPAGSERCEGLSQGSRGPVSVPSAPPVAGVGHAFVERMAERAVACGALIDDSDADAGGRFIPSADDTDLAGDPGVVAQGPRRGRQGEGTA